MPRILALLTGLLLAGTVAAQPPSPVQWSVDAQPRAPERGDLVTVTVTAEIESGWRVYAMDSPAGRPLQVRTEVPRALEPLGRPTQTQPEEGWDQWFESDYTFFTDQLTVSQVFRVSGEAGGGDARLVTTVTFMACDDEVCLPPRNVEMPLTLRIDAPASAAAESAPRAPTADRSSDAALDSDDMLPEQDVEDEASAEREEREVAFTVAPAGEGGAGMFPFILLAIGAGLAALLSPCVFPMIPLTVSFFVNQTGTRRRAVKMASVYGISIVAIFTGLGLALALIVGAAGPIMIASNPWVNLFIGSLLVVFGFSLLGFFELRLPNSWLNYFNRKGSEEGGYVGVLFMGFTLTLVSFSCTVPFVGALLAQAVRAEWAYPIVGMLVFSTTFALPFVGFALFPQALKRLPRSGGWMTFVKGLFGFLVIAAAIQFLSNADLVWGLGLLPRTLALALLIVIFALAGLFMLGRLQLGEGNAGDGPQPVGAVRLIIAISCFALSLYMIPGLIGAPLGRIDSFLPPQKAGEMNLYAALTQGGQAASSERLWLGDRHEAFARARATGQPVLIDFTGYTCSNCRYMEANVLSRTPVAQRIRDNFVPVKLWTDDLREGPELQQFQFDLTGRIVLPTYAIVSPDGELIAQISGITSVDDFVTFLDDHLQSPQLLQAAEAMTR